MKGPPATSPQRRPPEAEAAPAAPAPSSAQKLVVRIDHERARLCRPKCVLLPQAAAAAGATFDEAKLACKAARKRKERQESGGSLGLEARKVIRSNSEERPVQKRLTETKQNIRRVSSSGDFPRSASLEKIDSSSPNRHHNDKILRYDDNEHEKRRSHERFARPLTLGRTKKHPGKRPKVRYVSRTKTESVGREHGRKVNVVPQGNCTSSQNHQAEAKHPEIQEKHTGNFLKLLETEKDRSPSPINTPISPTLDFSTLHEQVDCSEPLLSCPGRQLTETTETMPSLSIASNRLLSSPRNSIIATHRIYLDPDVPQTNVSLEKAQNPIDERLQKLNKQINSLKKKIKTYEAEFEAKNGYKPSHVDKLDDKNVKKWYADLTKLKRDQKQLSEMSMGCLMDRLERRDGKEQVQNETSGGLQETVNEIDKRLTLKREVSHRCFDLDRMTSAQLIEEKSAVQRALLHLEAVHGRPTTKGDRNIARPLYDRYRVLKRMVSKINPNGNELATIHENETMHFVTPTSSSNDTESEKTENPKTKVLVPQQHSTDSDTDTSLSENLHALSKPELIQLLKTVVEEKKSLRRTIKEFEMEFSVRNGRMIQKEDKVPIESVYVTYKKTKAKLRLLEALVGKQSD